MFRLTAQETILKVALICYLCRRPLAETRRSGEGQEEVRDGDQRPEGSDQRTEAADRRTPYSAT